jgi:hypothetical protein
MRADQKVNTTSATNAILAIKTSNSLRRKSKPEPFPSMVTHRATDLQMAEVAETILPPPPSTSH